ncbi:MAG: hypothetical protein AAF514_12365 [Verrucomicrobiota bacterium]
MILPLVATLFLLYDQCQDQGFSLPGREQSDWLELDPLPAL